MKEFDMLPESLKTPVRVFGIVCATLFTAIFAAMSFHYFGWQGLITFAAIDVLIDLYFLGKVKK